MSATKIINHIRRWPVGLQARAIDALMVGTLSAIGCTAGAAAGPGLLAMSIVGITGARLLISGIGTRHDPARTTTPPSYCDRQLSSDHPLARKTAYWARRMKIKAPVSVYMGAVDYAAAFDAGNGAFGIVFNPHIIHHLSNREQNFVVAHELMHIKNRDTDRSLENFAVDVVPTVAILKTLADALVLSAPLGVAGTVAATSSLVMLRRMKARTHERRADLGAIAATMDPDAAISFFNRLPQLHQIVRQNKKAPPKTDPWPFKRERKRIFALHPPEQIRGEYIQAWKRQRACNKAKPKNTKQVARLS